jgi:hypothetical protein
MSQDEKRELSLLRELEGIMRGLDPRSRSYVEASSILDQLEELRGAIPSNRPVTRKPPKKSALYHRVCLCGHGRDDHRPYDVRRKRDGACLEDECACQMFVNRDAHSSRVKRLATAPATDET